MTDYILPKRGRPPKSVLIMTVERELTRQEVVEFATQAAPVTFAAPTIQRYKASHHTAARLVAAGKTNVEVAIATGYTAQRVSDLASRDPAFQELVEYYKSQINELTIEDEARVRSRLLDVAETALLELQDRVHDDAKRALLPASELRAITAMGLDRTVAPPKTAQPITTVPTKITFNIGTRDIRPKETVDVTADLEIEHEPG